MIAVITGDIINSRNGEVMDWMPALKDVLNQYGKEPKSWEIYRGDSFQLSVKPEMALLVVWHIKAAIKETKDLDVRMGIGLGQEKFSSDKITEANGSAYVNSGECFESLKKQTLGLQSNNKALDATLNIMFGLSLLTTNNWSSTVSEVVKTAIENPDKNQKFIADILKKSQSSVSEALTRGGFDEIMAMNEYYKSMISL